MRELSARVINLTEHDALRMVAFADDAFVPGAQVIFQLTKEPDDQDYDLGHDRLHIEIGGPQHSGYGLVRLIQFRDEGIDIHFTPEKLGLPAGDAPLRIVTNLDNTLWKAACTMLRSMAAMGGTGVSDGF